MGDAKLLGSRSIFDGRVVRLFVDEIQLPNGSRCELEVIRHCGASAVVPVDDEGNVLLVRQYRHATSGWILEVPAGKLDDGELPDACARREVEEETGYRPGKLVSMGWIWTTPGFTDEKIWLYAATDLEPTQQQLGEDEVLEVERHPREHAVELALSGEISDAKSVCALLRLGRFL
ncbi:MAG: NUDIX hydrolase [bacterium]|nr:NUDIX hydrolase [bacterium]